MITDLVHWLSGGDHQYSTLPHCMGYDWWTIVLQTVFRVLVLLGYAVIAWQAFRCLRRMSSSRVKTTVVYFLLTFVFCGVCSYGMPLVKLGWNPGRLEVLMLAILAFSTWQFARRGGLTLLLESMAKNVSEHEELDNARTFINTMPCLAWTARGDGWVDFYNDRWYAYTGTTPEQMEGWGWHSVHNPDYLPAIISQWKACLATGTKFQMTFPLRGANGRFRRFKTTAVPQHDKAGNVIRWYGLNYDIEHEYLGTLQAESLMQDLNRRLNDNGGSGE